MNPTIILMHMRKTGREWKADPLVDVRLSRYDFLKASAAAGLSSPRVLGQDAEGE